MNAPRTNIEQQDLARSLLPLVHEVAAQVARRLPSHVAMEDLVGAGLLGLAGALTRFDPDRAGTFKGYAEFRIRGEIMDELRRRDIMSREARIETKKLGRTIHQLAGELGREAGDEEVATRLGVSLDEYRGVQLRLTSARMVSTEDVELAGDEAGAESLLADHETRTRLAEAIEDLPERQRQVLWLYYYEELPLRDIADLLSVSPSRVCQIRSEAVERLRQAVERRAALAA